MKKLLLIVFLAVISFTGWRIYEEVNIPAAQFDRQRRAAVVPVEIAPIRTGTIEDIGVYNGSLKPQSRHIVTPKVTGRLEKLLVNVGDSLKPGQLVAVLDDGEYQQRLLQAKSVLAVAQANLDGARAAMETSRKEYTRIDALAKRKLISLSDSEKAKADLIDKENRLRTARAQLAEKQSAVEVARIQLSYTQINVFDSRGAPRLVVGERFVDEGTLLGPGTQIISVLDIGTLSAEIQVTEREYFKLKLNQPATIRADALPDRQFVGTIARLSPLIKEASRSATVEITIPNPDQRLRPGLFVQVQIRLAIHRDTRLVPVKALVKRGSDTGLFVVDLDQLKARFVTVQTGLAQGDQAEILSPDITGQVVTLGHHLLEDGSSITVPALTQPPGTGESKGSSARPSRPRS
jgi:RND family efflux transporter MFP subunit